MKENKQRSNDPQSSDEYSACPVTFDTLIHQWTRRRHAKKPNKQNREWASVKWSRTAVSEEQLGPSLDGYFASEWAKREGYPLGGYVKNPLSWIDNGSEPASDSGPMALEVHDKLLDDYLGIFIAAGVAIGSKERKDALPLWRPLTEEQKLASGRDAVRVCTNSEPRYIKSPAKHLADEPWTRVVMDRVLPVPAGQLSKAEQTRVLARARGWNV